jgi:hypothetical protein
MLFVSFSENDRNLWSGPWSLIDQGVEGHYYFFIELLHYRQRQRSWAGRLSMIPAHVVGDDAMTRWGSHLFPNNEFRAYACSIEDVFTYLLRRSLTLVLIEAQSFDQEGAYASCCSTFEVIQGNFAQVMSTADHQGRPLRQVMLDLVLALPTGMLGESRPTGAHDV